MNINEIDAAITAMGEIVKIDPVMRSRFLHRLTEAGVLDAPAAAKPKTAPPRFPARDEITAVQTAIFDNWPGGRRVKNHPNRYGCAMEVWTKPAGSIRVTNKRPNFDFKSSMTLMSPKALSDFVRVLRKPRITPVPSDYLDLLANFAESADDCVVIGLVNTNVKEEHPDFLRGVHYHANQFLLMRIEDGCVTEARFANGKEVITLPPFSPTDAAGARHGGNVVLQSRLDLCGFSKSWATSVE